MAAPTILDSAMAVRSAWVRGWFDEVLVETVCGIP